MVICLPQSQTDSINALDEAQAFQWGSRIAEATDYRALGVKAYAFMGTAQEGGLWWCLMEGVDTSSDIPAYLRQYITLWQGKHISLAWHSYGAPLTPAEAAAHDAVLASITQLPATGAYVRYDNPKDELCVAFAMPEGYAQLPDEEGRLLRTRFANAAGQGFVLDYGALLPHAQKAGLPWAKEPRTVLDTTTVWGAVPPTAEAFAALTGLIPGPGSVNRGEVDSVLAWGAQGRASGACYGLGGETDAMAWAWVQNGLAFTLVFYNMSEAEARLVMDSLLFLRLPH